MFRVKQIPWHRFRRGPALTIAAALMAVALMVVGGAARADVLGGYYYTDPNTGNTMYAEPDGASLFVDPASGYVLDSAANDYIDPNTGSIYYVDTAGQLTPVASSWMVPTSGAITVNDPPTLHVGQSVSSCPTGATGSGSCGYAYTAASQLISLAKGASFDVYQNSTSGNPKGAAIGQIAVIIAVPNTTATTASFTIGSSATEYNAYNTTATTCSGNTGNEKCSESVNWNNYVGSFTSSSGTDIYDFVLANLGLATGTGDTTTTFTNLSNAEQGVTSADGLKITPSNFGVYVYSLSTTIFGPNDLLNFAASNLPFGSIVLGVGGTNSGTSYTYYTTPLSQGGIVAFKLPEPGSMSMLTSCLAGLGFVAWRRRRRPPQTGDTG